MFCKIIGCTICVVCTHRTYRFPETVILNFIAVPLRNSLINLRVKQIIHAVNIYGNPYMAAVATCRGFGFPTYNGGIQPDSPQKYVATMDSEKL